MAKVELYKVAQKGNLPDILVPDREFLDFSGVITGGDVIGAKSFSKASSAIEHGEGLEVILQVGSQEEIDSLSEKKSDDKSELKIHKKVQERIRDSIYDTLRQEDTSYSLEAGNQLNYFLNMITSRKGFRGILNRFFPIIFILNQIPAYELFAGIMLLLNPKNYGNCQRDLVEHYENVEEGIRALYSSVSVRPVLNKNSLGLVNKVIKEDVGEEGYNNAIRIAKKLTLPLTVIDHLHMATQAAEHTQWGMYQKVPVGFATLPEDYK